MPKIVKGGSPLSTGRACVRGAGRGGFGARRFSLVIIIELLQKIQRGAQGCHDLHNAQPGAGSRHRKPAVILTYVNMSGFTDWYETGVVAGASVAATWAAPQPGYPRSPSSLAMIMRWTSEVPSPISSTFASR